MMHLMYKRFVNGYWFLISHRKIESQQYNFGYLNSEMLDAEDSCRTNHDYNELYVYCIEYMVGNARMTNQNVREEESSTCRYPLYNMVQAFQQPLYNGCSPTVSSLPLLGC